MTATEWHLEDRKRKRTLDCVEFKKGIKKKLPHHNQYDLTIKQAAQADARAERILNA